MEAGGDLGQGVSARGGALQVGGGKDLQPILLLQVAGSDLLADGGLQQAVGRDGAVLQKPVQAGLHREDHALGREGKLTLATSLAGRGTHSWEGRGLAAIMEGDTILKHGGNAFRGSLNKWRCQDMSMRVCAFVHMRGCVRVCVPVLTWNKPLDSHSISECTGAQCLAGKGKAVLKPSVHSVITWEQTQENAHTSDAILTSHSHGLRTCRWGCMWVVR